MDFIGKLLQVALLAVALNAALAQEAHAYLDPGTGSMVVQMVVGAIVAVGLTLRMYWHRLTGLLARRQDPALGTPVATRTHEADSE